MSEPLKPGRYVHEDEVRAVLLENPDGDRTVAMTEDGYLKMATRIRELRVALDRVEGERCGWVDRAQELADERNAAQERIAELEALPTVGDVDAILAANARAQTGITVLTRELRSARALADQLAGYISEVLPDEPDSQTREYEVWMSRGYFRLATALAAYETRGWK